MTRDFVRIAVEHQKRTTKVLLAVASACAFTALLLILEFSQKTETSGHLWWKETHQIPYDERRPYLLWGIGLLVVAAVAVLGVLGLRISPRARAWRAAETVREAHLGLAQAALDAARYRREAEIAERRRFENSTAGRAKAAFDRGDQVFSIELEVNGRIAQELNEILAAGWEEDRVHYRSHKKTYVNPTGDGAHEVDRETIKYATFLFRRRESPRQGA